MKFGVPSQRVARKVEQFPDTPVLTIGIDGGKGTSRAMTLNKKAVAALGLAENDATVAFAFEDKQVFITNGNQADIPDEYKIRVTKGNPRKISEKRTYTYLSEKVFEVNNDVENHLELKEVVDAEGTLATFELAILANEEVVEPVAKESKPFEPDFSIEKVVEAESFTETE
jgi:hypothetical protein